MKQTEQEQAEKVVGALDHALDDLRAEMVELRRARRSRAGGEVGQRSPGDALSRSNRSRDRRTDDRLEKIVNVLERAKREMQDLREPAAPEPSRTPDDLVNDWEIEIEGPGMPDPPSIDAVAIVREVGPAVADPIDESDLDW